MKEKVSRWVVLGRGVHLHKTRRMKRKETSSEVLGQGFIYNRKLLKGKVSENVVLKTGVILGEAFICVAELCVRNERKGFRRSWSGVHLHSYTEQ